MEERTSTPSYLSHATSQPSLLSVQKVYVMHSLKPTVTLWRHVHGRSAPGTRRICSLSADVDIELRERHRPQDEHLRAGASASAACRLLSRTTLNSQHACTATRVQRFCHQAGSSALSTLLARGAGCFGRLIGGSGRHIFVRCMTRLIAHNHYGQQACATRRAIERIFR